VARGKLTLPVLARVFVEITHVSLIVYKKQETGSRPLRGFLIGRGIAVSSAKFEFHWDFYGGSPPGFGLNYGSASWTFKEISYVSVLGDSSEKSSGQLSWFALQVRSRRESIVATQLLGQGYECFLPLYRSIRRWSDRTKELEQPLFPGYLFCRFDFLNCRSLLMTPGVQQVVGNGRSPIQVEESELESIRQALRSGLPNQPWPYLHVGERVRVNYGSLNNLEGILINFKGSHRVVLSVTLLQRSVAMEIDLGWVTPVRESRAIAASTVFSGQTARVTVLGQ
jgi:transcription antitermination factor NusG